MTTVLPVAIKNSLDIIYVDKEPNFMKTVWIFVSLRNIKLHLNAILTKAEVAS